MMFNGGMQWNATLAVGTEIFFERLPVHRIIEVSDGVKVAEIYMQG